MWHLFLTLSLFFCLCLRSITPAVASPTGIPDQPEARALDASDGDVLKDPVPGQWPRAPYTFRISSEPLYLTMTRYENPIDAERGDNFITRFLYGVEILIRDEGRDVEFINLQPISHAGVELILFPEGHPTTLVCSIQAGDVQTWVMGMKGFMELYGWTEVDMVIVGIPPTRRPSEEALCSRAKLRLSGPAGDVQQQ
ncbi:MAG: hypothetical protein Q9216_003346 [Gyalolechia sp. 2 TL-2023]